MRQSMQVQKDDYNVELDVESEGGSSVSCFTIFLNPFI